MSQARPPDVAERMPENTILAATAAGRRLSLLSDLACPACGREMLTEVASQGGRPASMACNHCGRRWPVHKRTPAFLPPVEAAIPSGAEALLHAPDVERWDAFCHAVRDADPALGAEVFDFSRDDWRFLLPLPPDAQVLLLGCGWGRLASSMADIAGRVYAVDQDEAKTRFVNARAYAEGRSNLLGITAGIHALPFRRASFHLVVVADPAVIEQKVTGRSVLTNLVYLRAFLAQNGALLLRAHQGRPTGLLAVDAWQWERRLRHAGFRRVEDLLALPDADTCSYVVRTCAEVPPGMAVRAFARYCLEPKSASRRAMRRLAGALPVPNAVRLAAPGHWRLVTGDGPCCPAVLADPGLPGGEWGIVAARSRPYQGARAHFIAIDPTTARPRFLVKVARDAGASGVIDREFRMLTTLREALTSEMRATIPEALARFTVHGHPASAQSYLEGRHLAALLAETPRRHRPEAAADLLGHATIWLSRFHRETARDVTLTRDLLDELLLSDLARVLETCAFTDQARSLLASLKEDALRLVGQRIPLVCEHRDFWAKNILMDGTTIRVVDWDLAASDRLPLGDLFELIHSLAFILTGDQEKLERTGDMLTMAYGGHGTFSRAVRLSLDAYCARLRIPREWGRVLLPLLMLRKAVLHVDHFRSGMAPRWLTVGVRFLEAPTRFPVILGLAGSRIAEGGSR
ncbi:MAG TPA: methyltransferase domain-containing protein [Armatimonadetes bacterium]|nr:methyltransferase domain-containing protein [Armatimonadota bacterium]